ncbi:TonB-dependent receptor [Sphingomonas naphthae]|uniref:TonB-dependent receptor n=1 Tax=Sphingomonas naphthae TaxID=1813468 RepID=A0ABY7TU14_9SPHN|nr:TonB-dependent receptor [Sphingomonas naphthae]WCT75354.1 TonB-dependent receptor [Sphingomonas naphthae]
MRKLFVGCAMAALATSAAYAQETTSSIRGSVDAAGAPVANATVKVTHVPSGTTTTTVTSSDGSFSASGLRIGGPFTVEVTASGYPTTSVTDIQLTAGQPMRLPISMESGGQDIVVTAARSGAVEQSTGPLTSLGRQQIAGVATVNRDIRDIARRDPFVTIDQTNSRAIEIAGQNGRLNKFSVDGVNFSDNFGLNNGGLPTNRGPVPIDAIEQLSVKVAPYDVSEGNFQGGAINVVLRSGANNFHGSAFYTYSDDGMLGNKTLALRPSFTFKSKNYGGFLSGPVIKDKLFFALSYEKLNETTPADILNSAIPNYSDATIATVTGIAQNRYSYAAGAPFQTAKEYDEKITAKVDWNITDGQRLSATYIRNEGTRGFQQGYSTSTTSPGVGLDSNAYQLSEKVNSGVLQLNSEWSDNFSTEVRGNYRKYDRGQDSFGATTQGQFTVCTDAVSVGSLSQCTNGTSTAPGPLRVLFAPDPSRQANSLATESFGGDVSAKWNWMNHNIKAIAGYNHLKVYNLFVQNALGTYYFDSIADFQSGTAGQLTLGGSITGNINDAAARYAYAQYNFAIQDSWDVTDSINITYGGRYDLFQSQSRPLRNANFIARYGFNNQETYDGKGVYQPRIGATWKVTPRLTIRGGGGLFAGQSPDVWLSNSFSNTGVVTNSIQLTRGDATCTVVAACNAALNAALNNVGPGGNINAAAVQNYLRTNTTSLALAATNSIDPGFQIPSIWKASLSVDYRLDLGLDSSLGHTFGDGWRVGGDFTYTNVKNAADYIDLRSAQIGTLPDGRPRYGPVTSATANQDLFLTNDKRGRGYIFVGRLTKKYDFGLSAGVTYTYQDIKDANAVTSSTASSNYGQTAMADPNSAAYGTSIYQIRNTFKFSVDFDHAFIGDYKTRIAMFGEKRSGRPYSFTMNDPTAGRSAVFGTLGQSNRYLLYVPNVSSITADPNVTYRPAVTIPVGATAAQIAALNATADASAAATFGALQSFIQGNKNLTDAQGTIIGKNTERSPSFFKIDLHVDQELPVPGWSGARFKVFADMENVLNFIDKDYGSLRQLGFPYFSSLVNVACATQVGTNCTQYRYSSFQNPNIINQTRYSLWQLRVGARFEF